ncbi:hypothetical protein EBT25_04465 [bacterium]|nr:hypothetical protein [bacterium]
MTKANTSVDLLRMIDPFGGLYSCWPYIGQRWHRDGYGYPKRNQKPTLAHRWSYEHHYGVCLTPKIVIRHICDNPACCNPLHLLPGTQADNHRDMHERQRWKPGKHPMALNQKTIEKIIQLRKTGLSYAKIATTLGCSIPTVEKYWLRHLNDSLM